MILVIFLFSFPFIITHIYFKDKIIFTDSVILVTNRTQNCNHVVVGNCRQTVCRKTVDLVVYSFRYSFHYLVVNSADKKIKKNKRMLSGLILSILVVLAFTWADIFTSNTHTNLLVELFCSLRINSTNCFPSQYHLTIDTSM